jgi:hypothetical protein
MEIDMHSTPGVIYVTVDPSYKRDESVPSQGTGANFFWLNGGKEQ